MDKRGEMQPGGKPPAENGDGPVKRRFRWTVGRIIALSLAGVAVAALGFAGLHYYHLMRNPGAAFQTRPVASGTPAASATAPTTAGTAAATPSPTPTLSPYELLQANADYSLMDGIVNVLLVGVDYAPERETWNGKHEYHADVMLLLAVNFKENKVDMISIPRDTYAKIPGVNGKYKINASINCGGGMPEGLPKVCESASWMLGGIPVDYYYAVTMPVVKELVDAIGGVEYDLDVDFTMAGRSYKKGLQYMDGQAVLDYLRVRKNVAQAGDQNRINRQKKMLLALFDACKERNLVVKFPEIVQAFQGKLFTNMSFDQTVALALFAYNLPAERIAMHSMGGTTADIYNWAFVLTDQKKRVELIQEVYGIDVPQEVQYSRGYCMWEWAYMKSGVYLETVEKMEAAMARTLAADAALATPTAMPTPTATPIPTATPAPTTTAAPIPTATPTPPPETTGETSTVTQPATLPETTTPNATTPEDATARTDPPQAQTDAPEADRARRDPPSGAGPRFGPEEHALLDQLQTDISRVKQLRSTYGSEKSWAKRAASNGGGMAGKAQELTKAMEEMKAHALALKDRVGYSGSLNWRVKLSYDIAVDFR